MFICEKVKRKSCRVFLTLLCWSREHNDSFPALRNLIIVPGATHFLLVDFSCKSFRLRHENPRAHFCFCILFSLFSPLKKGNVWREAAKDVNITQIIFPFRGCTNSVFHAVCTHGKYFWYLLKKQKTDTYFLNLKLQLLRLTWAEQCTVTAF